MGAARLRDAVSKDGREFQLYKAKFSNREAARKELFAQLQTHNDRLEKLLSNSDRDAQLKQQADSLRSATNIDPALCNFWKSSAKFFRALVSVWTCGCQEQHSARLLLQHRAAMKAVFSVTFATPRRSQWFIHQARVTEQLDDDGTEAPARSSAPSTVASVPIQTPCHRHSRPARSSMQSNNQTTCTEVELEYVHVPFSRSVNTPLPRPKDPAHNRTSTLRPPLSVALAPSATAAASPVLIHRISILCVSLSQTSSRCCGCLAGNADDGSRFYVYSVSRQATDAFQAVPLDQILRGRVNPCLTRRQRYTLALIVASSFLQYMDTHWLHAASW